MYRLQLQIANQEVGYQNRFVDLPTFDQIIRGQWPVADAETQARFEGQGTVYYSAVWDQDNNRWATAWTDADAINQAWNTWPRPDLP